MRRRYVIDAGRYYKQFRLLLTCKKVQVSDISVLKQSATFSLWKIKPAVITMTYVIQTSHEADRWIQAPTVNWRVGLVSRLEVV